MNDRITIPIWAIGSFLVLMNTTMFNVSLPSIITALHIDAGLGSWIVSGYSIVFALSTIIFSRLSDSLPIRSLLTTGLSILGVSSIIGYMADSFFLILLARLLQACGAGAVPGLGMILASRYIPAERRGRAITVLASGSILAFGLGPVIGGVLTQVMGFHGLFLIICLVFVLIPVLWKLLPKETSTGLQFDFAGALLTIVATASLLIALTQLSLFFLLIGIAAIVANIRHLRQKEKPFIHPSLLSHAGYRKLVIIGFCAFILNMSNLFLMPLVLAQVFHQSAAAIGLTIFPGAILSSIVILFIGRLIDKYGNFRFLLGAHFFLFLSILLTAVLLPQSPIVILLAYVLFAPSLSTITSTLSNEVSQILPKEMIGAGMGLLQLSQFLGGSFAVALCGLLLSWEKNLPVQLAFQSLFFLLALVLLGAIVMVIRYRSTQQARTFSA